MRKFFSIAAMGAFLAQAHEKQMFEHNSKMSIPKKTYKNKKNKRK